MKKIFLTLAAALAMNSIFAEDALGAGEARLQNFMAKIKRKEAVNVAVLGGSITTGFAANPLDQKSWAAITGIWFKRLAQKNKCRLTFENAGVSGTDSAFAVERLQDHIIAKNIDLVILEFAMNDQWLEANTRERTYEGVIRKIMNGTDAAILALFVNQKNPPYSSAQSVQQPICEYYGIPFVSWKDCLEEQGKLSDFEKFFDGAEEIHPNNAGHASIAGFITARLQKIWDSLPKKAEAVNFEKTLPPAKTDCGFEFATFFHKGNLEPVKNEGWRKGSPTHNEWGQHGALRQGWQSNADGGEIAFEVEGTSVGVTYCESDKFRNAVAWVTDASGKDGPKVTLDCYVQYRSGYYGWAYRELAPNGPLQKFTVHVMIPKDEAQKGKSANITGILVANSEGAK